ncbi:hypothetical protein RIR_e59996_A0A2I1FEK4_9GLOM [Rhizophagus irregularis DAOM 181602=DAOM 197198]|nr:hypothetical protein RIR_e59996_A0A2I1FEK4_9GLOM [Rhizophagus irregularis DAOM 181602=DAOM 197198]
MSSIIELSDIEEYNAEDFMDPVEIVNKDKHLCGSSNHLGVKKANVPSFSSSPLLSLMANIY